MLLYSTDINECSGDAPLCASQANCTNTEGDFVCQCPFGFVGDGRRSGTGCDGECIATYKAMDNFENLMVLKLINYGACMLGTQSYTRLSCSPISIARHPILYVIDKS